MKKRAILTYAIIAIGAAILTAENGCTTAGGGILTNVVNVVTNVIYDIVVNPDNGPTNAPDPIPQPVPPVVTPTNQPAPVVTNPPPVVATSFRGCLFTPASLHPALENTHGARSQMDYRDCHGRANEGIIRDAEYRDVAALGGNTLIYIQGKSNYDNPVLDMCLNARPSPADGHRFPVANPLTYASEADTAGFYSKALGVSRHLVWVWNDDKAVPFARKAVQDAVARYSGTTLDVWYGTCLETSEIASPADAAARLRDMRELAPASPVVCGACPVDWLLAVKAAGAPADTYYWLEQDASGSPVTDPVTPADWDAKIFAKAAKLAAVVGAGRVIIGEIWSPDSATRRAYTAKAEALGYLVGSGEWAK